MTERGRYEGADAEPLAETSWYALAIVAVYCWMVIGTWRCYLSLNKRPCFRQMAHSDYPHSVDEPNGSYEAPHATPPCPSPAPSLGLFNPQPPRPHYWPRMSPSCGAFGALPTTTTASLMSLPHHRMVNQHHQRRVCERAMQRRQG